MTGNVTLCLDLRLAASNLLRKPLWQMALGASRLIYLFAPIFLKKTL